MTYFVLFNELTLYRVLRLVLAGASVYLIPYPAVFSPLTKLLGKLMQLLARSGRCHPITQFDAHLAARPEHRVLRLLDDVFRNVESSMQKKFVFAQRAEMLGQYGICYKQVVCNYVSSLFPAVYICRHVGKTANGPRTLVVPDDVVCTIYETHFKEPMPFSVETRGAVLSPVCRALMHIIMRFAALVVAVKGLRYKTRRQHSLVAADFAADPADIGLLRELTDGDLKQALIVFRSRQQELLHGTMAAGFSTCRLGDGGFTFSQMRSALADCYRDMGLILRIVVDVPANLLTLLAALPYKRLLIQKLLASHQIDFFWARDEYNVEHILRTQELRRQGSLSMGLCHGLPSVAIIVPMIRYVDFDVYFTLGERFSEHYRATWSQTMKVRPVGSRGMTRARAAILRLGRASTDIIFQTKPWKNIAPLRDALAILATSFPDRRILLQVKRGFDVYPASAKLVEEVTRRFPNIVETNEKIYDLFLQARYLVSDPSTIVAEAIQFQVVPFLLDVEGQTSLFLREFPALLARDGREIVARIQALEHGSEEHLWDRYDGLVVQTAQSFSDAVRAEMGLPVKPLPAPESKPQCLVSAAAG